MKIEEISHKSANASNSGSEAYANAARSAWEKPAGNTSGSQESADPRPESGTARITSKSGSNQVGNGEAGEPGGGGGNSPVENSDGTKAKANGSGTGEKAPVTDIVPSKEGVAGEGKFEPADKPKVPMEEQGKATGKGDHSEKAMQKDKQDAALQHLPSLSIV